MITGGGNRDGEVGGAEAVNVAETDIASAIAVLVAATLVATRSEVTVG